MMAIRYQAGAQENMIQMYRALTKRLLLWIVHETK
jgi:hypothetical protein